jgi:hypothetical protein
MFYIDAFQIQQTDADISIARELNASNSNDSTGKVNCSFSGAFSTTNLCPIANNIKIAQQFLDIDTWLVRFTSRLEQSLY